MINTIGGNLLKILKIFNPIFFLFIVITSLIYAFSRMTLYQAVLILFAGFAFYMLIKKVKIIEKSHAFIVFLMVGIVLRTLYVIFVPNYAFSDFKIYHDAAISLSQNVPIVTKNIGFVSILSLGYRIFPDELSGKIINLLFSSISIILVYAIGKHFINRSVGLISMLIMALAINEINMVNVIATETTAEFFLLFSILFGILSIKTEKNKNLIIQTILSGICFGLGITVRSSILFFIIFFLIIFFFYSKNKFAIIFFIAGILTGFSIIVCYISIIKGSFSLESIFIQDSFPFLSGTNTKSDGGWNFEDSNLYTSWPLETRDKLAQEEAISRIVNDPMGFLTLLPKKFYRLFGPNDYGNEWSLQNTNWKNNQNYEKIEPYILKINSLISQAFYVIILLCAFYGLKSKKLTSLTIFFLFSIFISITFPYIILEVQPRYHHFLIPLIIPFSALGVFDITKLS